MSERSAAANDEKEVLAEINAFESAFGYNADDMKDLFARSPESFRRFAAARPMTMHYDDRLNQYAKDLLWVVNSPSLLSPAADGSSLALSQIDEQHLWAFMEEQVSNKVGPYFERLILYWLQHIRGLEIIAHALPIRDQGKTLGEIDFLFVDERGRLTHWEVAVKFYLYLTGQPCRGSHFVGPNSSDTFERKTQRMHEHQLLLSERIRKDIEVREAIVKGCLFYPPGVDSVPEQPRWMSANHDRGLWVHHRELQKVTDPGCEFRILKKPHWLSVNSSGDASAPWMDIEKFLTAVDQQSAQFDRPIFAARRCLSRVASTDLIERFFIVPNQWPDN
ncbi:hypothetical protein RISK_006071 [Rhodopirellula islandica]|uniref:DUF1853 family protein n=1 Tax=Rhodopirellula islandica TaxID=595434 RepID=A0A0J1B5A0_RHOIS|nr:DUF1853 family protein [Rhodopirellula islandica]KLU01887.1 hypothetical protein RISK_006071 [Rhodopirellula islandica]